LTFFKFSESIKEKNFRKKLYFGSFEAMSDDEVEVKKQTQFFQNDLVLVTFEGENETHRALLMDDMNLRAPNVMKIQFLIQGELRLISVEELARVELLERRGKERKILGPDYRNMRLGASDCRRDVRHTLEAKKRKSRNPERDDIKRDARKTLACQR
jgi:hypothetical protein